MSSAQITRRRFLRLAATSLSGLMVACTPQVVKETVVVEVEKEKLVEKEVTKVVKEAVEVEKEVTRVVEKQVEVAPMSIEERLGDQMPGSPDHPRGWKTTLPDLPPAVPVTPMITITCARSARPSVVKFMGDDDFSNNPWTRMTQDLFGVQFEVAWSWPGSGGEAEQKYNLAMASGDLPDHMEMVPLNNFVKMVEAGMLEDITDTFDMYASPEWKDTWREYGDLPWTWSRIDGRVYGLPRMEDLAHNDSILWYREDWLEKVGMDVPTTLDELHDVAAAFVKNDVGMGPAGSTIGLLANSALYHTWAGSIDSIWGAFGYVPDHWDPEGDKLMYAAIRPETKQAIALLNQWYTEGLLRKDFFTLNVGDSRKDVDANQCGLHFTPSWGASRDSVVNDPNARWRFADICAGPTGIKRRHTENCFREVPTAWRKGFAHVDKVFEVTNWLHQCTDDFWRRMHGWEGHNYIWEGDQIVDTPISWVQWAIAPVGTGGAGLDPKRIGREIRYRQDEWGKIPEDKRDAMQEFSLADPMGINQLGNESRVFILDTAHEGVMTALQRRPTPTMVERSVDLTKLRDEAIVAMIIGERPLSDFDTFVDQWKKLGGDQVTDEVNEWWTSK